MAHRRSNKHSIEGIIRRNPADGGQMRPRLDPFGDQSKFPSVTGLKSSTGGGLELGKTAKTADVAGAPSRGDELVSEEPKSSKKRWFHRRKKETAKPRRRKLVKRLALSCGVLLLAGGGFMGYTVWHSTHKIFKGNNQSAIALQKEVDPTKLKGEGDGRINILLVGIGGPGHDGPYLTDTLIIASLDPFSKEVALLSIPRDLWVTIKGVGSSKINSVLPNSMDRHKGDIGTSIKTLEDVLATDLDLPIHYYTLVDFTAFKQAIDTVGGIDIDVKQDLRDTNVAWENNNNPLIAAAGRQHMAGKKALLYARSRYGSLRGDFDRTQRQREVMVALKEKVFTLGTFSNPIKMTQLINNAGSHVQSDLSISELKRLYDIVKSVSSDKVTSLGLADPPHELVKTANVNGASVVVPVAGVANFKPIQDFLHASLVDGFIKKEKAQIVILNGSGSAGLAASKVTELKNYGYQVKLGGDYPTRQTTTQLIEVNRGKAPYTKRYLENRLKLTARTGSAPDEKSKYADFVIILGSNAVSQ